MILDQHHADMHAMLQMQQRLIGLFREALPHVPPDAWLERAVQMITDAEIQADIMKITKRSECQ